ncbi:MAG: hypothetical protein QME75_09770 [Deltaproteobacteria bacterium]|nr:hypothetical protein [Deltaproteobacteria bacterium]
MEIVAEWWSRSGEVNQSGLMFYGFVQLIASIWLAKIMKRPDRES